MSKTLYESSINDIYIYVFDIKKEEGNSRDFRKIEFRKDLNDYLEKAPNDLIIIDADEKGSAKSGISKFAKGLLLLLLI